MTLRAEGVEVIEITEETKMCANPACKDFFNPTRHNQKFCQKDCRKVVTNAQLKQQYHEKRARESGIKRVCVACQTTVLSRYNETNICRTCVLKRGSDERARLLELIGAV